MKSYGRVAVRCSKPTETALEAVIARYLPAAQAAGCICALEGLSGTSFKIQVGKQFFVARNLADGHTPALSLQRHYRALRRLAGSMAPEPLCLAGGWLIVRWLDGDVKTQLPALPDVSDLLFSLHRRPLFGWRISLLPLLEYYWQASDPQRRTLTWLRRLTRLRRAREPHPLRLAPLHMDIHAGNVIHQQGRLALIDWEYAGDGDIALELAATCVVNQLASDELAEYYAARAALAPDKLKRRVASWRPWVVLLIASWYEWRWQQTRQQHFIALADDAWRAR